MNSLAEVRLDTGESKSRKFGLVESTAFISSSTVIFGRAAVVIVSSTYLYPE